MTTTHKNCFQYFENQRHNLFMRLSALQTIRRKRQDFTFINVLSVSIIRSKILCSFRNGANEISVFGVATRLATLTAAFTLGKTTNWMFHCVDSLKNHNQIPSIENPSLTQCYLFFLSTIFKLNGHCSGSNIENNWPCLPSQINKFNVERFFFS